MATNPAVNPRVPTGAASLARTQQAANAAVAIRAQEITRQASHVYQFFMTFSTPQFANAWANAFSKTKDDSVRAQMLNDFARRYNVRSEQRTFAGDIKVAVFDPATAIAEYAQTGMGRNIIAARGSSPRGASANTQTAALTQDPFAIPPGGGGSGSGAFPRGNGMPLAQKKVLTDAELRQYVREAYGAYAAFLDMPEVGPILLEAAREGYSRERLLGALSNTNWWRSTSESQRTWDAEEITDPASTRQKTDNRIAELRSMATRAGLVLEDSAAQNLARLSLRSAFSEAQLREAAAAEAERNPVTASAARQSVTATGLRRIANDYAVRLSDEAISQWASRIGFGVDTNENFQEYVKEFAKSAYQSIAPDLDRGVSVRQWMDPYLQMAGSLLEMDPSTVDLTDPKWLAVLQQPAETFAPAVGRRTTPKVDASTSNTQVPAGTPLLPGQMQAPPAAQGISANVGNPPAQGGFQPMTLARWAQELRTSEKYGWDRTNNAKAEARQLADQLAKAFGKKG